ncbi:MAG: hypothetical protein V3U11_01955, partial [Planctomycetota bacterium]
MSGDDNIHDDDEADSVFNDDDPANVFNEDDPANVFNNDDPANVFNEDDPANVFNEDDPDSDDVLILGEAGESSSTKPDNQPDDQEFVLEEEFGLADA